MALVDLLGTKVKEKLVGSKTYRWLADSVAVNLFSLSFALQEKFIAGMDWDEVGKTRATAIVGNSIVGRPFGIYRDWVMKKFNVTEDSHWAKKYAAEVGAFVTGQTPFYLGFLAVGGAEPDEMVTAATFLTAAGPLVGTPQAWVYDRVRKQCGLETSYELAAKTHELSDKVDGASV